MLTSIQTVKTKTREGTCNSILGKPRRLLPHWFTPRRNQRSLFWETLFSSVLPSVPGFLSWQIATCVAHRIIEIQGNFQVLHSAAEFPGHELKHGLIVSYTCHVFTDTKLEEGALPPSLPLELNRNDRYISWKMFISQCIAIYCISLREISL